MATKGKSSVDVTAQSCGVCGGALSPEGECTTCGTKHELGANGTMVPASSNGPTRSGSDNGLTRWLSGEASDSSLQVWLGGSPPGGAGSPHDSNTEALKKWLTGDERSFDDWLGGVTTVAEAAPAGDAGKRISELQARLDERERDLRSRDIELDGLRAELDAFRKTVSSELSTFRSGRFDPVKYIEDSAMLNKNLQTEISKRKELEEEIEHIKKGSIAVIKYVKAQQLKSGASADVKKKLAEESGARRQLEIQLQKNQELVTALKTQVEKNLLGKPLEFRELKQRELALVEKEGALKALEAEAAEAARRGAPEAPGGANDELRERFTAEIREKEQEFIKKEDELKKRIILLEEDVNKFKIEDRLRAESAQLKGKPKGEVDTILAKKEQELLAKERSILLREGEIQRLKEELIGKEDEMKRLKEPLGYKEEELLRREEDLVYRERLLQAERQKVEHAKSLGGGSGELELKERLDILKSEIAQKEEEVRAKEKYLKAKMEELRLREQGLIEEEIEAREEERQLEVKQEKVKTGTPRLDDLLLGGIPFGTNVTAYGPAHVGKEVIVNGFMAEGLRKGVPIIWVLTDKMAGDIREEMAFVLPGYEEYEKLGLVRYIDAYSKSMGAEATDPNTTYIDDPTDHQSILKAVETMAMEWKKKYPTYRLAFRSVSTLIAYLDPTTTFKFLQPFVGRRKRDKAVAFYVIEKGMHEEQEIQMLGSLMDGSIEFKVEQLKSFLGIKGICDVQSRGWIRYTYTKSSVSVGSFSLDHIK